MPVATLRELIGSSTEEAIMVLVSYEYSYMGTKCRRADRYRRSLWSLPVSTNGFFLLTNATSNAPRSTNTERPPAVSSTPSLQGRADDPNRFNTMAALNAALRNPTVTAVFATGTARANAGTAMFLWL